MKKLAGIICVLMVTYFSVHAQKIVSPRTGPPGSWRMVGTVVANFTADRDVIVVTGPGDNFRKLKFKVFDAALNLLRMSVVYDNGAPELIEVRQNIPQGGESRVIDLRGGKRSIRKVEFWYDTKGILRGKAKLQLWGRK